MKISAAFSLSVMALALSACATAPTQTPPVVTEMTAVVPSISEETPSVLPSSPKTTPTVVTSEDVNAVMNAFIVRKDNAQETLEPVTAQSSIKAGDLIEYQVLLTNDGNNRVRDMRVALSLPQGTEFTGVVSPSVGTQASADGSRFVFMPIRTTAADGSIQNLPFKQYQVLRWNIQDLGIGATAVVKYRAVIK